MIHIFNRKELCITFDRKRKDKIIELLSTHNIEYIYNHADAKSSRRVSRAHAVSQNGNVQYYIKCTFYVKKEDYQKALHVIEGWI